MIKTRIILLIASALLVFLIFQLPKAVVENEATMGTSASDNSTDTVASHIESHSQAPAAVEARIREFRSLYARGSEKEKNAIFADSLATLYRKANRFDSAAWFAEEASKFFKTTDSWTKAGDNYYQAYTLALDQNRQGLMATKAQEFYSKVLEAEPGNLEVKTKMAMTYMTSPNPMQGIQMLMDVLRRDPKNELALFNMGMLSIQSGQNDKAIERLNELIKVNPNHIQGQMLLGIAWMNKGEKELAREQFEKVKQMDKDPAVQATIESYLKDLNK